MARRNSASSVALGGVVAALAVGVDALFAEVHPRPAEAWSDGPNSLDFAAIRQLLLQGKAIHDLA